MTTLDRLPEMIEAPEESRGHRFWRRVGDARRLATGLALSVLGASAPVALRHVREHAYAILGFGFLDAAAFQHSLMIGLIVTGVSFLVFEWKVSPDDTHG